jgi:hypothetical protein
VWTKLDDGILDHPKIAQVGTLGFAWFVAGLVYCNRNLTDGFIPYSIGHRLLTGEHADTNGQLWRVGLSSGMVGRDLGEAAPIIIAGLLEAGLWTETAGGFRVHDFNDYNPTKAEVLALRETRSEAGRRGGLARAKAVAKQESQHEPKQTASKAEAKSYPAPAPAPAPQVQDLTLGPPPSANGHAGPSKSERTALKDAIRQACGWDEEFMTPDAWGRVEKAAKALAEVEADPEDVTVAFVSAWTRAYPDIPITPQVIARNWAALAAGRLKARSR